MGATGYIIKGRNSGGGEAQKEVVVSPADGTIDVERVESDTEVDFRIKTTYDGYETISAGSPSYGGYFKAVHIKFNETNKRYRLVCILNGGSYTPVAEDFSFYYIKFGWGTGGVNSDHWYIQEYSRQGNGAYVVLEQIALNEYNVLIHTPTSYAYANIGILKEDKEPNVTIEHFNGNTTRYTPTGTIITTATPNWKNGSPAVWSVIPDVQNPVIGQLGHYYNGDRNLYFYDGYNWHNVYSLAQGVASLGATADRPATANPGTIYYDTDENNLKIFYGGEWKTIVNFPIRCVLDRDNQINKEGNLRFSSSPSSGTIVVFSNGQWRNLSGTTAVAITTATTIPGTVSNGQVRIYPNGDTIIFATNGIWRKCLSIPADETENQVVTFTNNSGETIAAEDKKQIIVTASFGAVSILDFSSVAKEEGKTIEINILSGSIIRVKDGSTEIDLTGCNESVVKAICLSNVWHFYKTSSITEIV